MTTNEGDIVVEAPAQEPSQESVPLNYVVSLLDGIETSDDFFDCRELFSFCASLDDVAFEDAFPIIRKKANELGCRSEAINKISKYRTAKKNEEKIINAKPVKREDGLFLPDRFDENGVEKTTDEMAIKPLECPFPWEISDEGISRQVEMTSVLICRQLVFPNRLFRNIENNVLKVELLYGDGSPGNYKSMIVDKTTISKASSITELAAHGVDVSSETARSLVSYLQEMEMHNRRNGRLKVIDTTSKFGWGPTGTKYEKLFVPYDSDLLFDGADNFREMSQALQPKGSFEDWLKLTKSIRAGKNIIPRIALAASFASVLVSRIHINPFIVDFWGVTEKGKTVLLMLAASVWADPTVGRFITTFRSTNAGFEIFGDVLNSLPMILDDSSNADQYLDFEGLVYSLCEGSGKTRSNKSLGKQRQTNWRNSILTNGERPLHRMVKQGGAVNRILEIDCDQVELFEKPRKVCNVIRDNYGHAGKAFVEALKNIDPETLLERFEEKLTPLPEKAMNKQRQAAACILLADDLATEWIFKDENQISGTEIAKFLTMPDEVSEGQRAYQYLADIVSMYQDNFRPDNPTGRIALWGKIDEQLHRVYFFRTALDEQLKKGGFDLDVLINWCRSKNLLVHSPGKNSTTGKVNVFEDGEQKVKVVRFICIVLDKTILPTEYES